MLKILCVVAAATTVAGSSFRNAQKKSSAPTVASGGVDGPPVNVPKPDDYPAGENAVPYPAFPKCAKDKEQCNVLVVVDMQKDYCKGCGSPTESQWASAGVKQIATPINSIIDEAINDLDLVLFTQDFLAKGTPFLVHDTVGAEVLDELKQPAEKTAHFTKGADDWMNHGFWHGRKYAIQGEAQEGAHKPESLDMILDSYGFSPKKTNIYVVGTATYRCVMKGSVHARALGYTVSIVENSVEGEGDDYDWGRYGDSSKNENAVKGSCKEMLGISEKCGEVKQRQWMETVYDTRGGPSPELRKKILHHAHVHSCADAAAVKASINGTPCPQSPDVYM